MQLDDKQKSKLGILFTEEQATEIVKQHAQELGTNGAAYVTDQLLFAIEAIGANAAKKIYSEAAANKK